MCNMCRMVARGAACGRVSAAACPRGAAARAAKRYLSGTATARPGARACSVRSQPQPRSHLHRTPLIITDMPRHESEGGGGCAAWARRWWRALVAELCGTALLVWLGVGSLVARDGGAEAPLPHVAQGFGCVVVGCLVAFGPTSGAHMNPAVTLAATLSGTLSAAPALGYALAQLTGATLGYAALLGTMAPAPGLGVTQPAPDVGAAAAALLEATLTGLLALACCALWAAPHPDPAAPLKVGLLVAGLIYAGGSATGASLNPARSFAPALLLGRWEAQWVYWVGPLGGAAAAALLHRYVLRPAPAPESAAPEELPLDDKP